MPKRVTQRKPDEGEKILVISTFTLRPGVELDVPGLQKDIRSLLTQECELPMGTVLVSVTENRTGVNDPNSLRIRLNNMNVRHEEAVRQPVRGANEDDEEEWRDED